MNTKLENGIFHKKILKRTEIQEEIFSTEDKPHDYENKDCLNENYISKHLHSYNKVLLGNCFPYNRVYFGHIYAQDAFMHETSKSMYIHANINNKMKGKIKKNN